MVGIILEHFVAVAARLLAGRTRDLEQDSTKFRDLVSLGGQSHENAHGIPLLVRCRSLYEPAAEMDAQVERQPCSPHGERTAKHQAWRCGRNAGLSHDPRR